MAEMIGGPENLKLQIPDEETPHRDNRARQEASVRQMIYGVCGVVLAIAATLYTLIYFAAKVHR